MRPTIRFSLAIGSICLSIIAVALGATQNYLAKFNSSGALIDSAVYESSGNLGIGTDSPTFGAITKGIEVRSGGASDRPGVRVFAGDAVGEIFADNTDDSFKLDTRGSGGGFKINSASNNYMTILFGGNVGFGTVSPTAKLHVAGDIKVDGNIAAKYQDVAEWVTAREPAAAGTVMVISPDDRNVVHRSHAKYDTGVAGVVSPQPGITLGEKGEGKVLVAQSGRVLVKVDATYGEIRAGDLLVTSPTPGHAMRSQPLSIDGSAFHRPGTILGKALEPMTHGKGEILILLTLQ
ncbi:MAG TPA: hypothetical protein VJM31_09740 [Vicinamibacterales bacterium]|nr:hypothetical protein [Vicinamibacterales bacterium]